MHRVNPGLEITNLVSAVVVRGAIVISAGSLRCFGAIWRIGLVIVAENKNRLLFFKSVRQNPFDVDGKAHS